ncbi:alpha/beta fold hydrolase [Candidatus Cyanaurora vandensis]|uniref:alpha/beta fold hydrolase n=1 Tax=Candidatus Cyanaurora vandensis TaxID=2714958 RepID=UPI002580F7E9|nr:alpha/beta fold hydrolase [Candidatus Cyanaurora vandensis]
MTVATKQFTYWQWRGYRVRYRQAGTQGTPILLVHGFGASADHWRYNIPALAEQHRVWAIDLLGFGRSEKPDLAYDGDLWRDQLRDFCQEMIQEPAVVAGNSLGGYAALCLAADHPELVRGLVLLNGAGPFEKSVSPYGLQGWVSGLVNGLLQQRWASDLLFEYSRSRSRIRRTLLQVYKDPRNVNDELVEDIYQPSCDPGAPRVFARVFSTPQGRTLTELLAVLQVPLLLLWGDLDPWMTAGRATRIQSLYPQATLVSLQAGHCPHDECPELVNQELLRWTTSLGV